MKTSTIKRAASCIIAVATITTAPISQAGPPVFTVIARQNAVGAAPGVPTSPLLTKFAFVGVPSRAPHSTAVAFLATLANVAPGGGVNSGNNRAIYVGPETSPLLAVREGDFAPDANGFLTTARFRDFNDPSDLNGSNDFAFRATLALGTNIFGTNVTAADDLGLWSRYLGVLHQVAREGDFAPDANGVTGSEKFRNFPRFVFPQTGDVVFHADLVLGGAVTTANDQGIWGYDPATPGLLICIIREGDTVLGNTVASVALIAGSVTFSPGQSRSFGEDGDLDIKVTFVNPGQPAILKVQR